MNKGVKAQRGRSRQPNLFNTEATEITEKKEEELGTYRYVLTENRRTTITALLTARRANVEKLTALAA